MQSPVITFKAVVQKNIRTGEKKPHILGGTVSKIKKKKRLLVLILLSV